MPENLPLNALRAFEAAARHLSFTRAASELNVLQPSVSRRVAELEEVLGTALFIRRKPRLKLTEEGHQLQAAVSSGFSQINQAMETIQNRSRSSRLVVNTSIGFATCWLMDRIAGFSTLHPDIELELVTRDTHWGYDPEYADVVVLFGKIDSDEKRECLILPELLMPVCGRAFPEPEIPEREEALAGSRLLFLNDMEHKRDWEMLFAGIESEPPKQVKMRSFNSYIVYLQAILNGDGIGLGWGGLIDNMLADGRLRRVTGLSRETDRGYFCMVTERASDRRAAHLFRDWIISQGN